MDVYLLNAKCYGGEYMEKAERMPDMEEKPKCFTGYGKRIDKKKIGVIEEGNFNGSFIVYLTNPTDIPHVRERLHQIVCNYAKKEFEKAKANLDAAEKMTLTNALIIRDY